MKAGTISTMNLVEWEFLLCERWTYGFSALLFRLCWEWRLFSWEKFWCKLQHFF